MHTGNATSVGHILRQGYELWDVVSADSAVATTC